jgi:hypothetical protein
LDDEEYNAVSSFTGKLKAMPETILSVSVNSTPVAIN